VEHGADHEPSVHADADEPIEISADHAPTGNEGADEPIEGIATSISEHASAEPGGDDHAEVDLASSAAVSDSDASADNDDSLADGAATTSAD
ncbi:MAG: hypothetical protein ABIR68_04130, partial [Ilumatobacteraceae bacterium]